MNFKTTLVLVVLVAAGALLLKFNPAPPPALDPTPRPAAAADAGTRAALEALTPEALVSVKIGKGDQVTELKRGPDGAWTMPGNWLIREPEVQALVGLLGNLRSRFEPIPITGATKLSDYGLDPEALTVRLETDHHKYTLRLGEGRPREGEEADRLSAPTYLRLDDKPEVVRLAPGLVATLDRPRDYYQRHRLFPGQRVVKEDDSAPRMPGDDRTPEKVERLDARSLAVSESKKDGVHYTLARNGDGWELQEPRDRLEPRARDALLAAVPDVWAERFVEGQPSVVGVAAGPAYFWATRPGLMLASGLDKPERTLTVTRPDGSTVTLLIGKVSGTHKRKVAAKLPPNIPQQPFAPREIEVTEEYRYAKLRDNDQVFEINAEKLKDVFVPLDQLRDPRLARFEPADARRLEITHGGQHIVLAKEKERWKLLEPIRADAEEARVTDLLNKLSGLEARDKDVIDKADPKAYALDKPGTVIKVTVEEKVKGARDDKEKKTRTLTVALGKHDTAGKKVYARADDLPRINAVDDSVVSLAGRPALAYRGKRVLDFGTADLARIDVERPGGKLTLVQGADGWRLAAPVAAEADGLKAGQLAGTLGALEALEYVENGPRKQDLENKYGLGKSALAVTLTFKDAKKPARTLYLGKARTGKPGYFARLGDSLAVFAVNATVHEQLDRDALAYRPAQLWQVLPAEVAAVRVRKAGQDEYRLTRAGSGWQISGPFTAPALAAAAQDLATALASPQNEGYKAHEAKDLKKYGLDNPSLTLTLTTRGGAEHTLLVGKASGPGAGYFAKADKGPAVFVVSDSLVRAADRSALDLLDRQLVKLTIDDMDRIVSRSGDAAVKLQRKGDRWDVVEAPGAPFTADVRTLGELQMAWAPLVAERFAAYGVKGGLAKYGLDKPSASVTVHLRKPGPTGKAEHTVELGAAVEGQPGERYARVDKGPAVAVLGPGTVEALARGRLDFVDHNVLALEPDSVKRVQRHMGTQVLEAARTDDGWQLSKPTAERADDKAVQDLLGRLAALRAQRIAAFPVKDLKPFGLDKPAAILTVGTDGGKAKEHLIKVGKVADAQTGARFAVIDGGPVAVLPGRLSGQLLAAPLAFRDRSLAKFADADRIRLEQGPRKATFAKVEGTWKLVSPVEGDAEQDQLEDFINTLARLRADELVAEKVGAEGLKKYGLDRPEARWRLQSGDQDVLQLSVGKQEKGGPRRYARLAGRDLVFLLDPQLSARVVGEFRPRNVWPAPLDAVQVEALRYDYVRNPFVLEKSDGGWRAHGKPKVKVNAQTVNETLATLARLQLARYANDRDSDLKLFGLQPPELTLEVVTRTGKRVLQVGSVVGDSKRRYARVADPARPGVFILDEKTCALLFRDLNAFTRPPAQPSPPDLPPPTP